MSTRSSSSRARRRRSFVVSLAILSLPLCVSCGYSQGQLLFILGVGRGKKVPAKFHLTDGPVLILIDDTDQRVDWPPTRRYLYDELAQELLKHHAASKIVPPETVARLRQSEPGFERTSCRKIGAMAGAEQVLWIEITDFRASKKIENTGAVAYLSATVKVVNAAETKDPLRVRLWPTAPLGHFVTVGLNANDVSIAGSKDRIAKKLAARMAERVAKLFYEYRLGDFERQP